MKSNTLRSLYNKSQIKYGSATKYLMKQLGLRLCRASDFEKLLNAAVENNKLREDINFLLDLQNEAPKDLLRKAIAESNSQVRQDVMALVLAGFKKNGFFVEIGAGNGYDGSNTYLLENNYGWRGILSEPAKYWHADIYKNRSCIIDQRCVFRESKCLVEFREADGGYLSAITATANDIKGTPRIVNKYNIETVSLVDLFSQHNAPKTIDFLSIDTEGSELEIIKNFDFSSYEIKFISIEHNQASIRDQIREYLKSWGYVRVDTTITFEDWYVSSKVS